MAYFKISDIYSRLHEMLLDGYEYADIVIYPEDDDMPECIHFDAIEQINCSVDYEEIESTVIPEDYDFQLNPSRRI